MIDRMTTYKKGPPVPASEPPPVFPTLYTCYRPIEQYLRLRSGSPAVTIEPLDAFLMYQVAAFLPDPPSVVDYLADATGGASVAFWCAHPGVTAVSAPATDAAAPATGPEAGWRVRFAAAGGRLSLSSHGVRANGSVHEEEAGGAPTLFLLGPDHSADEVRRLFAARPDALGLVLPLGRIGECPRLEALLAACPAGGDLRLVALREVSPFFASSGLAIVAAASDPRVPDVVARLAALYEGNFQFLHLARLAVEGASRDAAQGAAQPEGGLGRKPSLSDQGYQELTERIRWVVDEVVPAGATLIVVSKGDERLVDQGERRAWHFPQDERGVYAGHHPADSATALALLEGLRERGGEYLLVPATATWWFEYYAAFRRYLEQNYSVACCRPETCMIFDLRETTTNARLSDAKSLRRQEQGRP